MGNARLNRLGAVVGVGLLALTTGCGLVDGGPGVSAKEFRDGQVFKVILGSSPGGSFDAQARLLEGYLDKAIDQAAGVDVQVQVENKPGADHRVATEAVNNSNEPAVIFSSLQLLITNSVLKGADYDLAEMTPVASAGRSPRALAINRNTAPDDATAEDVLSVGSGEPLLFSHPGLDADMTLLAKMLREQDVEFKYESVRVGATAEIMQDLIKGNAQAAATTTSGMVEYVEDNKDAIRFVAVLGCETDPSAPDVPTIVEQKLPGAEKICKVVGYDDRVFFGPPGMSPEMTDILRKAFKTALNNEEYRKQALKAGLVADYSDGAELKKLTAELSKTYTDYDVKLPEAK